MKQPLSTAKQRRVIHVSALGVCLAITATAYFVGIHPQIAAGSQHAQISIQLFDQNKETKTLKDSFDKLEAKLEQSVRELAATTLQLTPITQLNQQLNTLTVLAEASSLTLHKIQPGSPIKSDLYLAVPIQVAGVGTYRTAAQFLNQLHKACPDIGVTSIELSGQPASETNHADFHMILSWYTTEEINHHRD